MVGGIVLAMFAVIYALVIRKVGADYKTAWMDLLASRKDLRDRGEKDLVAAKAALTAGEVHRRYANVNAVEADEASVAQYEMAVDMVRTAVEGMERNRDQVLGHLAPFMESEAPSLAFTGPRSRKLKLTDDSHLTAEDKGRVHRSIRAYNKSLAVSPRRASLALLSAVKPVDVAGRQAELYNEIPPDQEVPVLDLAAFEKAGRIPTSEGPRVSWPWKKKDAQSDKPFGKTRLHEKALELVEAVDAVRDRQTSGDGTTRAMRARQNGGRGSGRGGEPGRPGARAAAGAR